MSIEEKQVATKEAAASMTACASNMFEGKVISMLGNKLVVATKEGKERSHTLATDAKVTRDGTTCKAADVRVGSMVRVTTKKEDHTIATGIESLDKQADFTGCCS